MSSFIQHLGLYQEGFLEQTFDASASSLLIEWLYKGLAGVKELPGADDAAPALARPIGSTRLRQSSGSRTDTKELFGRFCSFSS